MLATCRYIHRRKFRRQNATGQPSYRADQSLEDLLALLESENLPIPSVAYELPDEEIVASLAWLNAPTPVAILIGEQQHFADTWTSRGYRVPPADMAPSEIIRGLKHHIR